MPGGRPTKLTLTPTPATYEWGQRFKSEREMCNLLEQMLPDFIESTTGHKIASYTREYRLRKPYVFGASSPRVDFKIETDSGELVLVECKNTDNMRNLTSSLGQLLGYAVVARAYGDKVERLMIVTSVVEPLLEAIIEQYELPITLAILTDEDVGVWHG